MATATISGRVGPLDRIWSFLRRPRVARWTSRLVLRLLWQAAGLLSGRFAPTA
jgi:hypothetical protein